MTRILVIDDDAVLRSLVRMLLERQGYCVVEAANGAEGLQCYAAAPVDLVITDIQMPVMDGLELMQLLRHSVPTAVVIALSGNPHALTQARTFTPYTFAKPCALRHLLATVQTLVAAPASLPQGSPLTPAPDAGTTPGGNDRP